MQVHMFFYPLKKMCLSAFLFLVALVVWDTSFLLFCLKKDVKARLSFVFFPCSIKKRWWARFVVVCKFFFILYYNRQQWTKLIVFFYSLFHRRQQWAWLIIAFIFILLQKQMKNKLKERAKNCHIYTLSLK